MAGRERESAGGRRFRARGQGGRQDHQAGGDDETDEGDAPGVGVWRSDEDGPGSGRDEPLDRLPSSAREAGRAGGAEILLPPGSREILFDELDGGPRRLIGVLAGNQDGLQARPGLLRPVPGPLEAPEVVGRRRRDRFGSPWSPGRPRPPRASGRCPPRRPPTVPRRMSSHSPGWLREIPVILHGRLNFVRMLSSRWLKAAPTAWEAAEVRAAVRP